MTLHLSDFIASERGTVTVGRIFAGATAVFLLVSIVAYAGLGGDANEQIQPTSEEIAAAAFRAAHDGRDRGMVLAEGPRDYFSPNEIRARYDIFSDPRQTTDEEVRSAHRTWVRRMEDHAYSQPGRANDMVLLLNHALEVRGLEPHSNI